MFPCKRCPELEKRIDHLIEIAQEERKLLYISMERERAQWARERSELLTRIQAWTPNPEGAPPESQAPEPSETADGKHTVEELSSLGLVQNTDGGFLDVRVMPPVIYYTVEECLEVRALLKSKGLPQTTNPTLLDVSFGEVLALARQHRNGGVKEDEA